MRTALTPRSRLLSPQRESYRPQSRARGRHLPRAIAFCSVVTFEPCSINSLVELPFQTVSGTETVEAYNLLPALNGFIIELNADVTFRAGNAIALGNGLSVATGAKFRTIVEPSRQ